MPNLENKTEADKARLQAEMVIFDYCNAFQVSETYNTPVMLLGNYFMSTDFFGKPLKEYSA